MEASYDSVVNNIVNNVRQEISRKNEMFLENIEIDHLQEFNDIYFFLGEEINRVKNSEEVKDFDDSTIIEKSVHFIIHEDLRRYAENLIRHINR